MPGDFDFNTDDSKPKSRRSRDDRDDDRDDRRDRRDRDDDDRPRRRRDEDDEPPRSRAPKREEPRDDNPFNNEDEPAPNRRAKAQEDVPEATVVNPAPAASANPFQMDEPPTPKERRSRRDDDDNRDDRDDRDNRRSRSRRSRDDDDRDERSSYRDRANKKSPLIIIGVILGGLILVGGAVGGVVAFVMTGKDTPKEVAKDKDKANAQVNKGNSSSDKQTPEKKGETVVNVNAPTKEVITKVKRNTVYIRVLYNDKRTGGTGSGFVERKSKYVITNAHVVGALKPKDPGPAVIELIFNSGEDKEFAMYGELIALDREADLAVIHPLRNSEKMVTLPEGLTVAVKPSLTEFQPLFVFGFPFGESLGKEITATNTTVASIRKTQLQLNGGLNPGNSGGPVVDIRGNVVGVAVAKIKQTTIDFAIPCEILNEFLTRENLN